MPHVFVLLSASLVPLVPAVALRSSTALGAISEREVPTATRQPTSPGASLVVDVENLGRGGKGKICVAVFSQAEGFPSDLKAASKTSCVPAEGERARVSFDGLAPGTYAVSAIHDENEDGKLNTGAFGIPREGFGFSNNPPVRMGAPGFRECTFEVNGATRASVKLHNL